jgi:hypothetical protein
MHGFGGLDILDPAAPTPDPALEVTEQRKSA